MANTMDRPSDSKNCACENENLTSKSGTLDLGNKHFNYNAKPHKCPICNGKGIVLNIFYSLVPMTIEHKESVKCKTCKGEGIVWG